MLRRPHEDHRDTFERTHEKPQLEFSRRKKVRQLMTVAFRRSHCLPFLTHAAEPWTFQ